MNSSIEKEQQEICKKYGLPYYPSPSGFKIGVALNIRDNLIPINGLRHSPERDTAGWYIWSGENLSNDPDFFQPLHVEHLHQWYPKILKYLGLPPGWRFLVAEEYEDVWYDETL